MNKTLAITISTLAIGVFGCTSPDSHSRFLEGDILFQDFPSPQSDAIKIATGSEYSHCGVLFYEDGEPMVYEAVQPVRVTPLNQWIGRDADSHFVALRLKDRDHLLSPERLAAMRSYGSQFMGRNYDPLFEWGDERLYCSELVWKIYANGASIELCRPRALREYSLDHPIVLEKLAERYGDDVPLDQYVVAPSDLFSSDRLSVVEQR
ncbi:YiiX family permuted papain-like enzyme [bacterium]|nr:YiiX family permuted papain-like enzyme [bacterium]